MVEKSLIKRIKRKDYLKFKKKEKKTGKEYEPAVHKRRN